MSTLEPPSRIILHQEREKEAKWEKNNVDNNVAWFSISSIPKPSQNCIAQNQQPRHNRFSVPLKSHFAKTLAMSHQPAMEPQKLIVVNNQNEKLVGLLHDTGSQEIVIVCHGFTCRKEVPIVASTTAALEKEGMSAFRFDFSGNGESDGSFEYGNYMKEVEDLHAVVKLFNGSNRIVSAIVGHSKGGDVVLLYASTYHDVRTVVNLSGRYDLKEGIVERLGENYMERIKKDGYIDVLCSVTGRLMYRVTEESLMDRLNTNMHEACLKIDPQCRILTIHGSADEVIPVEDASEFAKIIPHHKLHILEGANHAYSNHIDEMVPVVVDFIKVCLQQDKENSA